MNTVIKSACGAALAVILVGCGDTQGGFTSGSSSTNIISDRNFDVSFSEPNPAVLDDEGYHGNVEVDIVVTAADRNNAAVTSGTVQIRTEYGTLDATSCQLNTNGQCTVKWLSILEGIPTDLRNQVVAYTTGEESFIDHDGSGSYNSANDTLWNDEGEPFIDLAVCTVNPGPPVTTTCLRNGTYDPTVDVLIDINQNGIYDLPINAGFNGIRCDAGCGTSTSTTIWTTSRMNLDARTP